MRLASHYDHMISTEDAVRLIMSTESDLNKVNKLHISDVLCNAVFLNWCTSHEARLDYRRDGFGVWRPGHHRSPEYFNSATQKRTAQKSDLIVRRLTSTNKAAPDLRRTEVYITRVGSTILILKI